MAAGLPGATPFGGHAGSVNCVAFSPDGGAFATGGDDGVVRLWDTASVTQTQQLTGHTAAVLALAWSPDGSVIASGGEDATVRLWDVATATQTRTLTGHSHPVGAIAWRPESTRLASAANTVRVWDAETGEQVRHFYAHSHKVRSVAWSPDGITIASGAGSVRLWEAETGRQFRQLTGHGHLVGALAWGPDGRTLATGAGSVRLWDTATGTEIWQVALDIGSVEAIVWQPDGDAIAVGGYAATVWLLSAPTGTEIGRLEGHAGTVDSLAWHPGGAIIATASHFDYTVRLWKAAFQSQTKQVTGHSGPVHGIAWHPGGTRLATHGLDGTVRVWDAATGEQAGQLGEVLEYPDEVTGLRWCPDGETIATAFVFGGIRIWNLGAGTVTRQGISSDSNRLGQVAWNPGGTVLAIAVENEHSVLLWDAKRGRQAHQLTGPDSDITGMAWHPDGAVLAVADEGGSLLLWDAVTGEPIKQLTGHNGPARAIAWSPDGAIIAASTAGGAVWLWDTALGQRIQQFAGHVGPVRAIAWRADGGLVATASDDSTLRLWDPVTGEQVRQLVGHTRTVYDIAWSPDGSTLASTGRDGTIRIWNPRNGEQLNGTGFGARRAGRPLAGVSNDSPSDTDLLGVVEDVAMLAELIAANETRPPLAIALIGDWGAGKSSVMLQMEKHVEVVAAKARSNPGVSAWAETVRQVRFNAWHYSGDQLWSGLVSHLFDVLATLPGDERDPQDKVVLADPRAAAAERARLKARRDGIRRANDQLERTLKAVEAMSRPEGPLGWLVSPWHLARMLLTSVWQVGRNARAGLLILLGWVALGVGAYAAWHYVQGLVAAAATVFAVLVPPTAAAVSKACALVADEQARLSARLQEYQRDIRSVDDQLILVDAAERLARFLKERGEGGDYRKHQGLLGQVRADLDRLAADLAGARRQWERDGRIGSPPLERIVLYIDDLDRCPPHRVVEVLEAVHLMLALDLFVVVVAVDARWLVRSLEYHHHVLFKGSGADENLATPIDYLDKIFQIPFTLLPPGPDATADYLRSLLPQPALVQRPPSRRALTASAGASTTPDPTDGVTEESPGNSRLDEDLANSSVADAESGSAVRDPRGRHDTDVAGRSRVPPSPAGGDPVSGFAEAADIELRPLGLQVSQAEVEFMARLGVLLPTPRVAKRLVNLYRLVRIGIRSGELAEFVGDETGGPYQAVQVLLALLVGHPRFATEVFRMILDSAGAEAAEGGYVDLATVVEAAGGRCGKPHSFWSIHAFLVEIRKEAPAAVSMAECRRWCPRLARFSFYTRELAGSYRHVAASAAFAHVDLGRDALAQLRDMADDADDATAGPQAV